MGALGTRIAALETEVRRSKRREEKLQAMQFRLREDLKACGGDLSCASVLALLRDCAQQRLMPLVLGHPLAHLMSGCQDVPACCCASGRMLQQSHADQMCVHIISPGFVFASLANN